MCRVVERALTWKSDDQDLLIPVSMNSASPSIKQEKLSQMIYSSDMSQFMTSTEIAGAGT